MRALEQQYDAFVAQAGGAPGVDRAASGQPLPSGDEIAAQVEQFLAEMDERGRDDS